MCVYVAHILVYTVLRLTHSRRLICARRLCGISARASLRFAHQRAMRVTQWARVGVDVDVLRGENSQLAVAAHDAKSQCRPEPHEASVAKAFLSVRGLFAAFVAGLFLCDD